MKAKYSSETSVDFHLPIWCHVPEDKTFITASMRFSDPHEIISLPFFLSSFLPLSCFHTLVSISFTSCYIYLLSIFVFYLLPIFLSPDRPHNFVNEKCVPFLVMGPEFCLNKMARVGSRETVFSPLSLYHLGERFRNFSSSGLKFDLVLRPSQSLKRNFLQFIFLRIYRYHFQISHVLYLYLSYGTFAVYTDK